MSKAPKGKRQPYFLGALRVDGINDAIGTELDSGNVVMSVNAQKHAMRRHPEDFGHCFPHVASVIANPLYVRDDFKNDGKIELIGKPEALGGFLLVAVELKLDANGNYNATSFYPISQKKIDNRRDHLKRIVK